MRVRHNRKKCIGCNSCVIHAPQSWLLDPTDGLARFIGSQEKCNGEWCGELHTADLDDDMAASEHCPVKIIHIEE